MNFSIVTDYWTYQPPVERHRPFRRYRHFFNPKDLQQTVENCRCFANSLLGKLTLYSTAEVASALMVGYVTGKVGGAVAKPVGALAGAHLNVCIAAALAFAAWNPLVREIKLEPVEEEFDLVEKDLTALPSTRQTSKIDALRGQIFLSLSLLFLCIRLDASNQGAELGFMAGEWIGDILGGIAGGYLGLKAVGANPLFLGGDDPMNSYAVSMIRFVVAGIGYDIFLGYKLPIPFLGLPRTCLRALVQTAAFNYFPVKSYIETCIREKTFSKAVLLPFVAEMIANVAHGTHSNELAKKASASLVPSIPFIHSLLKSQAQRLVGAGIHWGIGTIADNSADIAGFILRSIHAYILLVQGSPFIQEALNNPAQLKKVLHGEIETQSQRQELFRNMVNELVKGDGIENALKPMKGKIIEWEKETLGFSIFQKEGVTYLRDAAAVHLHYYVIFALLNWNEFTKAVSNVEEEAMCLDFNAFFCNSYLRPALSPMITSKVQWISGGAIYLLFRIKKVCSLYFKK